MSNRVSNVQMKWYDKYGYLAEIKRLREEKGYKIVQIARELNLTESRVRVLMKRINVT